MGIRVSRSAQDAADEPPLNLAQDDHAAETSDGGGTGVLAWLGAQVPHLEQPLCVLRFRLCTAGSQLCTALVGRVGPCCHSL